MAGRTRERLLALVAAICVGAFATDKLVVRPLLNLWKERSERIVQLKQSVDEGLALLDREDALTERWTDWKSRALPADLSAAEKQILQAMSEWTQTSRLGVTSLKPRWLEEEEEGHKRIECRVVAEGGIAALARFLYELESDPLGLRVESADITARDDSGRTLTLSVRFTGLVLSDEQS